ncbi:MAG TPA: ATP-binding protein [Polyangia bacterium]|nr:ATP-binding protein [Polyangia bacterium]
MALIEDEKGRLAALARYGVLDTPAEPEFDRITALTARLFRVPTVAIILVDVERTWSKSRYGLALPPQPRAVSFCGVAIQAPDVLVVPDARADARFTANPLVAYPGLRFVASAPICTPDGHNIGCLEIADTKAREMSATERDMLASLAAVVMDELELRATLGRIRRYDTLDNLRAPALVLPDEVGTDELDEDTDDGSFTKPRAAPITSGNARMPAFREAADMRLAFVTHQLPSILWTTDRELRATSAIGAGLDALGIDAQRVVGQRLQKVLGVESEDDAMLTAHRSAIAGTGGMFDWTSAEKVWQCWVEPLLDPGGGIVGAIGIALDITERARLQKAVRDREAHDVQADRLASLGTLAAGVAHEINNPLTYVFTNVSFALERLGLVGDGRGQSANARPLAAELDEVRTALGEAREGAERVKQIVRDLRSYSRADDDVEKVVDVRHVIDWSVNMTMNEIRHRARLVKTLDAIPGVRATETRLGQVFVNLLVNAAQAIAEGHTADNEIRVSTSTDAQGRAVVRISDTGPGIAPETLAHVFEPFFTTKPRGVGLGLGLFVCHGIIKGLGGTLEAESTPGQGATFVVTLPPAPPKLGASPAPPAAVTPAPRRVRVLAIDDEPQVLRSIQRALSAHEVVVDACGRDALERLERDSKFDVILCDLMMGDMTGMDLHTVLSRRSRELAGRIVFMTGGVFTDGARDFLAAVPNTCIEKPFDLGALRAMVAAHAAG